MPGFFYSGRQDNFTIFIQQCLIIIERRHDKTNKMSVRPAKTQISLGICQYDQSSLSAWRNLGSLATLWAHSEDSDQTGRMPRLIWVFAGRTATLLVLSCRGSYHPVSANINFIILYMSEQINVKLTKQIHITHNFLTLSHIVEEQKNLGQILGISVETPPGPL